MSPYRTCSLPASLRLDGQSLAQQPLARRLLLWRLLARNEEADNGQWALFVSGFGIAYAERLLAACADLGRIAEGYRRGRPPHMNMDAAASWRLALWRAEALLTLCALLMQGREAHAYALGEWLVKGAREKRAILHAAGSVAEALSKCGRSASEIMGSDVTASPQQAFVPVKGNGKGPLPNKRQAARPVYE